MASRVVPVDAELNHARYAGALAAAVGVYVIAAIICVEYRFMAVAPSDEGASGIDRHAIRRTRGDKCADKRPCRTAHGALSASPVESQILMARSMRNQESYCRDFELMDEDGLGVPVERNAGSQAVGAQLCRRARTQKNL